jgi:acyl-CoA synthetase (AMP-forming)/AMP-acid ligase II
VKPNNQNGPTQCWFNVTTPPKFPPQVEHETLGHAFLDQALRRPKEVIIADQTSGDKTYRDLLLGIFILRKEILNFSDKYVGIMMPASVGVNVMYLATIFAGKIPVMINWTLGRKNLRYCVESLKVSRILTSRQLVKRLKEQGFEIEDLKERFIFVEDIRRRLTLFDKLKALLASRFAGKKLLETKIPKTAVILFTSGSESIPKAVPLTHRNILANLADVFQCLTFYNYDSLLGFLPPFHSFGLTITTLLPMCFGVRAVYYPNPTHGQTLSEIIEAYRVTIIASAPTFLDSIIRHTKNHRLSSVRLVITGAEKCPLSMYEALAKQCPNAMLLEGYGVTETSPVISVNDENDPCPGTIGKMLKSFEYAVVDRETFQRANFNQPGMLLVRGPSVFGGYLNHEGPSPFLEFENKQWYRTGDLVKENENHVLTFVAREKRFIKRGGEMISLPAIESVLDKHFNNDHHDGPTLAVVASPEAHHPDIVVFTTNDLDRKRINQVIQQEGLSGLHNIRRVIRLNEMPILGTGKTDYRSLAENLKTQHVP